MATSAAAFAQKCHRYAAAVPNAQKVANLKASDAIKHGWLAISGVGPDTRVAGGRVGVRYDQKGHTAASSLIRFYGPAHLLESNTKPRIIAAKRLATRTGARKRQARIGAMAAFSGNNKGVFGTMRTVKRGAQALTIGSNLRAYAFHPGTRGRKFWPRCKQFAVKTAPRIHAEATMPALLRQVGFR